MLLADLVKEAIMRDLSWVKKQGQIIEREKRKIRQKVHRPPKEKLDSFAELYEAFEYWFKKTERIFGNKHLSEKIKLQNRISAINSTQN